MMLVPLAPGDETAYDAAVDRGIDQLLHIIGPALGLLVILFAAWDAWVDAAHADTTLRIRVGLVLLGRLRTRAGGSTCRRHGAPCGCTPRTSGR
jgi:hypothetical protein